MPGVAPGNAVLEARFGMYVSLQDYARMKLREGTDAAMAEERHGKWYGRFGTEEALQMLDREGGIARWRQLERELDNLVAACRRAAGREDGQTAAAAYGAAWRVLELRGPFGPAVELGREVLRDSRFRHAEEVKILMTLGLAEAYSGKMEEARTRLEAVLVFARAEGDRSFERIALVYLAATYSLQGRAEEARAYLEMALALARAGGDPDLVANVLNSLGVMCRDLGYIEEARSYLEMALNAAREVGNRRREGVVLGNLGLVEQDRGCMKVARVHYEAALAIHRETGHRRFEGNITCNLGGMNLIEGRMEEAHLHLEAALAIHREVGDRRSEGIALSNLGSLHTEKEQLEEARADYEAALAIHRELGNRRFEVEVLMNLANLMHHQKRIEEAWDALTKGEAILRQLDAPVEMCKLLCIRAEFEQESGSTAAARSTLESAEAIALKVGSGSESELGQMVAKIRQSLAVKQ